jgi:hypothetical protein
MPEMFDTVSAGAKTDLFGWNLYNCYAYLLTSPRFFWSPSNSPPG